MWLITSLTWYLPVRRKTLKKKGGGEEGPHQIFEIDWVVRKFLMTMFSRHLTSWRNGFKLWKCLHFFIPSMYYIGLFAVPQVKLKITWPLITIDWLKCFRACSLSDKSGMDDGVDWSIVTAREVWGEGTDSKCCWHHHWWAPSWCEPKCKSFIQLLHFAVVCRVSKLVSTSQVMRKVFPRPDFFRASTEVAIRKSIFITGPKSKSHELVSHLHCSWWSVQSLTHWSCTSSLE